MNEPRIQRFHLLGVGGTAMASLAGLLKALGHQVQGSDGPIYPPMSEVLATLDVRIFEGFDPANLDPIPDVVVVGNAIPRGNPELEAVLERDLPYISMPALIARLILNKRLRLVVSGTHGKTTTTNLAAWLLHHCGLGNGWLVGGSPLDLPASFALGQEGGPFVIEGDEYDTAYFDKAAKFFHYRPQRLVVNAVEFDHADIYSDLDQIELQFRRLVNIVPRTGRIVVSADDAGAQRVCAAAHSPVVRFGVGPRRDGSTEPEFWAPEIVSRAGGMDFELRVRGRDLGVWSIAMPGAFNVLNALAALALVEDLQPDPRRWRNALAAARGVRRRLELRGEAAGVRVWDDFAHHPTAVAAAIRAISVLCEGRLIAVLEPRSWTLRRRVFEPELALALSTSDLAFIAPVYQPDRLSAELRLSPARVAKTICQAGKAAEAPESVAALLERLCVCARAGDAVLIMSNGGFEGIHARLLAALAS